MILERIIEAKKEEVARLKTSVTIPELERRIADLPPAQDFREALDGKNGSIIAEIKRRSPSGGILSEDFDVTGIARLYEANGAAAISVLTERDYFAGDGAHIAAVNEATLLPVLRKDFIFDPYQVYETRVLGGDALLLIAGLFDEGRLRDFLDLAGLLGLSAITEVHTGEEARKAVKAGAGIIGINNRDLRTFRVDLGTSLAIAPLIPEDRIVVSESGIESRADIERLMAAGIRSFLIGGALMRAGDRGAKLRELAGR